MKQCVRLTSMKRCQVARSEFSIATSTSRPPTLLTRISMGRPWASAFRQRSSQIAGSATSATNVQAFRPRSRTSSAVRPSASGSLATSMTSAPASAAAIAIARPNPRLPPVTRMHLPSSRNWSSTVMSQTPFVFVAHSFSRWRLCAKHRSLATGHFDLCAFRRQLTRRGVPSRATGRATAPAGQMFGRDFCVRRAGTWRSTGRSRMSGRNEYEYLFQEAARRELARGGIDRRDFLTRSLLTGLGLTGVGAVAKSGITPAFAADRPLTPTFYQWIQDLHPGIPAVNAKFPGINYQIAPVEGFGIERFVAEAKNKQSTWDVYVGQTPFVEMSAFIKAGVIEPWDNYIPKEVIDDIIPSIREECTVDGKLYSWPFFLDVIGSAWHSGITTKAGVPDAAPATWEEFLASSKKIVDSKAAPWGATFDSHGWRSLAPITHSLSTKVYTPEGLFDFTSEPAIEALKLMKQIIATSNPDILLEGGSDGGVNGTTDELAFASQRVGLYFKYFNAPLRMATSWDDPKLLHLGPLPKFANGEGSTVFWTTGCALFKYGQNKEKAAEYIKALTYDSQIWKDSIVGTPGVHPGQLPPYTSIYSGWNANKPDWMPPFVSLVRSQLDKAKAIDNHVFGLQQFVIGKPIWESYLKGDEPDPKVAMTKVMQAVQAEIKKG